MSVARTFAARRRAAARTFIRSVLHGVAAALLSSLLGIASLGSASAQTFTEFATHSIPGTPYRITSGPDGALWLTNVGKDLIVRLTQSGSFTSYSMPAPFQGGQVYDITTGPDGALWFTGQAASGQLGFIGRITPSGVITTFTPPAGYYIMTGEPGMYFVGTIISGPDGALWFTGMQDAHAGNYIGRITTSGQISAFPVPQNSWPGALTTGPDGALWYTDAWSSNLDSIGRMTTEGAVTLYRLPNRAAQPSNITTGSDGALWFTEYAANSIGRITTSGAISEYPIPTANAAPTGIALGHDGLIWFTESYRNKIASISRSGTISEYVVPWDSGQIALVGLDDIVVGPDTALWFTQNGEDDTNTPPYFNIGRYGTPQPAGPLTAAVVPASESVVVNTQAPTAALLINGGNFAATNCSIVPATSVPANFTYQTTDPTTGNPTGTPNTPVSIAPGASQTFLLTFVPTALFAPETVTFDFGCGNASAAPTILGFNTLLLSSNKKLTPNILSETATTSDDGILHIPGNTGTASFAVTTENYGAGGSIKVSANTGSKALPITLTVCETKASGKCVAAAKSSLTLTIPTSGQPSFAVFAKGAGAVPVSFATNRIFVQFSDSAGIIRGLASVAVQTN